jgi:hypothetical protein
MHRLRPFAAAAALTLLGAAACADDDDTAEPGLPLQDDTTTTTDAVGTDDDTDRPIDLAAAVAATLAEDDAGYTIRVGWGPATQVDDDGADTGTGADDDTDTGATGDAGASPMADGEEIDGRIDFRDGTRQVTLDIDGEDVDVVIDGATVYLQLPDELRTVGAPGGVDADPDETAQTGTDTGTDTDADGWVTVQLQEVVDGDTPLLRDALVALHDPAAVLRAVEQTAPVTPAGPGNTGTGGGDGEMHTVTIDADDVDDPVFGALARHEGLGQIQVMAWIDDDRVDRIAYELRGTTGGMVTPPATEQPGTDGADTQGGTTGQPGPQQPGRAGEAMPGQQGTIAVVVEFDDFGDADEIDVPTTAQELSAQDARLILGRVTLLGVQPADPGTGTGTGTGTDGTGTDGTGTGTGTDGTGTGTDGTGTGTGTDGTGTGTGTG